MKTPLHSAAIGGELEAAKMLLAHCSPDEQDGTAGSDAPQQRDIEHPRYIARSQDVLLEDEDKGTTVVSSSQSKTDANSHEKSIHGNAKLR